MSYQIPQPMMPNPVDQPIVGDLVMAKQPDKQAQRIYQQIDLGILRANGRATFLVAQDEAAQFVTESAMMGVVRVSMFEQMCGQIAPSAAGRLQVLGEAYAIGAARRVMDAAR